MRDLKMINYNLIISNWDFISRGMDNIRRIIDDRQPPIIHTELDYTRCLKNKYNFLFGSWYNPYDFWIQDF